MSVQLQSAGPLHEARELRLDGARATAEPAEQPDERGAIVPELRQNIVEQAAQLQEPRLVERPPDEILQPASTATWSWR